MKAIKCDRCGQFEADTNGYQISHPNIINSTLTICSKCWKSYENWIWERGSLKEVD